MPVEFSTDQLRADYLGDAVMKPSNSPLFRLPIYDGVYLKNWLTIGRDPTPRWKRVAELSGKQRPNEPKSDGQ